MVQALLAGTKTQTRRSIKPQPKLTDRRYLASEAVGTIHVTRDLFPTTKETGLVFALRESVSTTRNMGTVQFIENFCKYQVGDVLYVKETYTELVGHHRTATEQFIYKADCSEDAEGEQIRQDYIKAGFPYQWKSSMFMPKVAARLFLGITQIRAERLLDISEADAIAEGIAELPRWPECPDKPRYKFYGKQPAKSVEPLTGVFDPVFSYLSLWASINGEGSVKENPYVWVIDFKRIEKPS